MQTGLVLLAAVVQAIHHAYHRIGGYHVGALAAHVAGGLGVFHMLQLLEQVKTFEHHHQLVAEEGADQTGIPYEVVGVQLLRGIFATGIEIEIIGQI